MKGHSKRTLGTIIYLLGLLLGLALAIVVLWGDFEATSYFNSGAGYAPFAGLNCPALMSPSEVATLSATFENPGNREIQPYYEVEISGAAASRNLEGQPQVAAHSSKTVSWTVDANDIDLGYFVMAKINVLPFAGNPARESTCGIAVLNLMGMSGGQILGWGLGVSLVGIVLGLGLSETGNEAGDRKTRSLQNGLRAAGVAVLLALLTALTGSWVISLIFCAITILLLLILLRMATG
jgi:hypothetical protein